MDLELNNIRFLQISPYLYDDLKVDFREFLKKYTLNKTTLTNFLSVNIL
jgi:hypothetical protein